MKSTIEHKPLSLNIGAEGEEPGCIQINLPWVLQAGDQFIASRNGEPIGVKGIKQAGPLIICDTQHLPFANNTFDRIIANGVPIDRHTHMGPGYCSRELARVCKNGFVPPYAQLVTIQDEFEATFNEDE